MAFSNVSYKIYIYKVLKQVHPETGMSSESLSSVNNLVRICIEKIMTATNRLMLTSTHKTLSARDIQSAVKVCLPGEIRKHAISEGTKALGKYRDSKAGGVVSGKSVPRGVRAGLAFPVTRTENIMVEQSIAQRKSDTAAVYLTAVLEYLTAEIMELSGNAARDGKRARITPRHIQLAIRNDAELSELFSDTVLSGGVVPNIHVKLLPKKKGEGEQKPKKAKKAKKAKDEKPKKAKKGDEKPKKKKAKKAKDEKPKKKKAKKSKDE